MKPNLLCFLFLILVNLFYYAPTATASPIINGIADNHHRFKYHVSIHTKENQGSAYELICCGSIISERYILTAAHCFVTKFNGVIRDILYPLGTTKIIAGSNHRNGPGVERNIIRAFVPVEFNVDLHFRPGRLVADADIAVAELNADLCLHQHQDRLAAIPLGSLNPHSNAGVNEPASFCGFGPDIAVQHGDGRWYPAQSGNTINRFMNVTILGRSECAVFNTEICTRHSDGRVFRSPSYGDSGAGLVHNNQIVGVLSSGPRHATTIVPIIFTRLHQYMRFINEAQNPRGDRRFMMTLDANRNPRG